MTSAAPRWPLGLIPTSAWGSAGRTGIPPEAWGVVRRACYARAHHRCEACGANGRLEAHEWYQWDDARGIQRLGRIAAACPTHHAAVHLGRTRSLSGSDRAAREALAELAQANGWSVPQAALYARHELALCAARSKRRWTLDLSALAEFGIAIPPVPGGRHGGQRGWLARLLGGGR